MSDANGAQFTLLNDTVKSAAPGGSATPLYELCGAARLQCFTLWLGSFFTCADSTPGNSVASVVVV